MIVGIGTDLVEVSRVAKLWAENRGGLERRVFTTAEVSYCVGRANASESLAGRFAAKEAALKALGTGWGAGLGLAEVEVVKGDEGAPGLIFHGNAAEKARALGVSRSWLSITHTEGFALAFVVLESGGASVDEGRA